MKSSQSASSYHWRFLSWSKFHVLELFMGYVTNRESSWANNYWWFALCYVTLLLHRCRKIDRRSNHMTLSTYRAYSYTKSCEWIFTGVAIVCLFSRRKIVRRSNHIISWTYYNVASSTTIQHATWKSNYYRNGPGDKAVQCNHRICCIMFSMLYTDFKALPCLIYFIMPLLNT